jgi:hypothetical protein
MRALGPLGSGPTRLDRPSSAVRRTSPLFALAVVAVATIAAGALVYAYLSANIGGAVASVVEPGRGGLASGTLMLEGSEYLAYCGSPGGQFAALVWLRNDGPLSVTLEGADPGPGGPVSDTIDTNGFSLADLAVADPDGRNDPRTASVLPPTELAPGQSIRAWARFNEGPRVGQTPSLIRSTTQLWVRVAVSGMSRVIAVSLGSPGIAMTATCPTAEDP